MTDRDTTSGVEGWGTKKRESLPASIAAELSIRIRSGEFGPGAKLPSEPALAQMLSVSRNTVREAIGVLREQSLVVSRHGLGTFVLDPARESPVDVGIEQITSSTELIERAGHKPGTRQVGVSVVRGERLPLQYLQLPPGEAVRCVERVRTADDVPVLLCRDYVSVELSPGDDIENYLGTGSLFAYLQREYGHKVRAARADIIPVLPSVRVAELMEVSRRKPLLLLRQVHFDDAGTPFLYSENYFNPDFVDIHVRRTLPADYTP